MKSNPWGMEDSDFGDPQSEKAEMAREDNEQTNVSLAPEVANASDANEAKPSSRHLTPLNEALFIGGTVAVGLGLAYAGYRYTECSGFSCESDRPKLDLTTDVISIAVAGAFMGRQRSVRDSRPYRAGAV